jgi:hypothetical protein
MSHIDAILRLLTRLKQAFLCPLDHHFVLVLATDSRTQKVCARCGCEQPERSHGTVPR